MEHCWYPATRECDYCSFSDRCYGVLISQTMLVLIGTVLLGTTAGLVGTGLLETGGHEGRGGVRCRRRGQGRGRGRLRRRRGDVCGRLVLL